MRIKKVIDIAQAHYFMHTPTLSYEYTRDGVCFALAYVEGANDECYKHLGRYGYIGVYTVEVIFSS